MRNLGITIEIVAGRHKSAGHEPTAIEGVRARPFGEGDEIWGVPRVLKSPAA
jgi:hypothetical protein